MPAKWSQAFSLVILVLNVTRISALDTRSVVSNALNIVEGAVVDVISEALDDSDGVLTQFTMSYNTAPPISSRLINSGFQSDVTIGLYCESCDNAVQPSAFDFASTNYTGWDKSWLGFALDSFNASFELEVDLSAGAEGDLTLSLLKETAEADGVVVEVDFQLYLVAEAQAEMSFTAGLNLSLASPAAIMMPALDPLVQLNQSQMIGFNQSNFILTPIFNASIPQVEFSVQISLRTVLSITLEEFNVGALFLDLPAFKLNVTTLTNALKTCKTAPSGTPSDQVYAELIHMNGALVANLSYELLGGDESGVIEHWNIRDELDECYAFFPGLGFIGTVPSSSKSELLSAAPITTCTTGGGAGTTGTAAVGEALKGLSPRAKAGAVIGTLTGVTLVAILAFFAGRGNLDHAIKKARTRSAWTAIPRPRADNFKFFGLANRRSAREFSSVAPNEETWQTSMYAPTTAYGGGYFPTSTTEMGQHAGWQTFKKDAFVSMGETDAVTPAATYAEVYNYGVVTPSSEAGETNLPAVPKTNRSRYNGEQAEGLGLLQSPERPVMQRREISRKPVAGQRL